MTITIPISGINGKLSENGLLSTEGVFYPCESGYHDLTCQEILGTDRETIENTGWVLVINKQIIHPHPFTHNWSITQDQYVFLKTYIEQYPDPMSMFYSFRVTRTRRT